ncbi:MAG: hypothetical protein HC902_04880 [Calothrix sp. SM1_5_4]|nr:hypothetical protein [Calothrix sp. SM1_5_4]
MACGASSGEFFMGALGLGTPRVAVAVQNTGANHILLYDLNGALVDVIWDSTAAADIPKGSRHTTHSVSPCLWTAWTGWRGFH